MECNQRTVRALSFSARGGLFHLFPSVATKCSDLIQVPFSPHLQSRGVMVGSGAWRADWEAGWMELLW